MHSNYCCKFGFNELKKFRNHIQDMYQQAINQKETLFMLTLHRNRKEYP